MRPTSSLLLSLLLLGCVEDPRDPNTWVKKLKDPREQKAAVRELVRLNDPMAVPPLIQLFQRSHDPEHLKAIAHFKDKRAVPVMIEALDYSEESFDLAATAATALGDTPDPSAVEPLVKALRKPLPIKARANVVKLEAMRSLSKLHDPRAVDAIIHVLETPADDQDFYLNQVAAVSLGEFGDPRAVPALIRGLFMTGRGADIYQPCRVSLLQIGKPAVQPLISAMQRQNPQLEADAKKYEFRPGVIVQKSALVLGDLRAREAVPALLKQLGQPAAGDAHRGVLYALGMIADPATFKEIAQVLGDPKREYKDRIAAAEAINLAGDTSDLGALLGVARGEGGKKKIAGPAAAAAGQSSDLRVAAAIAFSRLGGAAEAQAFAPVVAKETEAKDVFAECAARLAVAKQCANDVACYARALDDAVLARQEKAAFTLARLGKPGLPPLLKKLSTKEPLIRFAVLFGIGRLADSSCSECKRALDAQIEIDRTKPPLRPLVDEMRAVRAQLK